MSVGWGMGMKIIKTAPQKMLCKGEALGFLRSRKCSRLAIRAFQKKEEKEKGSYDMPGNDGIN